MAKGKEEDKWTFLVVSFRIEPIPVEVASVGRCGLKIFITGGTGLVGRKLIPQLLNRQDSVVCVTREVSRARELLPAEVTLLEADPILAGDWQNELLKCDAVVNLAGEAVAEGRWTKKKKSRIRRSRLSITGNIAAALVRSERPMVLVNASAVGYYGNRGAEALGEDREPGQDFLARLAVEWEHTAAKAEKEGIRVALLRIGIVLAPQGGALAKLAEPFRWGMGGPIGSGKQYFPWLHIQDLVRIILFTLDNDKLQGPINAVVPNPPLQKDFAAALGTALGKPSWLAAPEFALHLLLGQKAEMILASQRAVPNALKAHGFRFAFGELDKAMTDLFPLQGS